ncbi:hypothetical protein MPH_05382 [Macrophomina phaseolina MS6]|uniref:Uncharacterized protein n=1 Tax=Macrophomina phaseolina (strain MS6) TaxID=1126212 RepID=K2R4K5_MACPH|nr:hypothetical protein MPH_05382 [Macrophomina phaseolina MS6]
MDATTPTPRTRQTTQYNLSVTGRTRAWLSGDKAPICLDLRSTRGELAHELRAWVDRRIQCNKRFIDAYNTLAASAADLMQRLRRVIDEGRYDSEGERTHVRQLDANVGMQAGKYTELITESSELDAESYFLRESLAQRHGVRWVPDQPRPAYHATAVLRAMGLAGRGDARALETLELQDWEFVDARREWGRIGDELLKLRCKAAKM